MAKQSSITYERVKEAAEKVRAAGRNVSNREVRNELGGGSYDTIAPLLKRVKEEWRREEEAAAKLAAAHFPADIASAYFQNVKRECEAVRENLRHEIEDLRIQVEEAEEAFAGARVEIEELSGLLTKERGEAAGKVRDLEIAVGSQKERAAALDEALRQMRGERDSALVEKAALASDQARLRLDLERSNHDLQETRQRADHLTEQVESFREKGANHAQRAAVAERHAADTQNLCDDLKARCQSLEEDCRGLQGEHRTMTARLLDAQTALAEARQQASTAGTRQTEVKAAAHAAQEAGGDTPAHPASPGNGGGKKAKPEIGKVTA